MKKSISDTALAQDRVYHRAAVYSASTPNVTGIDQYGDPHSV